MSDRVRPEKVQAVADIRERLEQAEAVFITEYAGLSVPEQQDLRRGLRHGDTEYKVLKMTLTRRAVAEMGLDDLEEMLTGPTALAFTSGDPQPAAKTLADFASAHEALVIKGMLMAGEVMSPEKVSELAMLQPREVLLARVAGAFQAPMGTMAGLMAAFTRNAASMFLQLRDRKEAESPAEAAAAAEDGATADEAPEATAGEAPEAAIEAAEDTALQAEDNTATPAEADDEPAEDSAPDQEADEANEEE